jgi:hypothetical protein
MPLPMNNEELQHIQAFCHKWLREPGASHASRRTILAGGALSHPIELEISELLTFENVLIRSAIDAKNRCLLYETDRASRRTRRIHRHPAG